MEATTPTPGAPPPAQPAPGPAAPPQGSALAVVAVLLAVLEVALAWFALQVSEGATQCPQVGGGPFGCAAVFRPRLSRLFGPLTVTQVAFVGAMASLGFSFMLNRSPPRGVVAAGLAGLGLGAGLALGLQPLPWFATGTLCPMCLTLAALTVALLLTALLATRGAGVSRAWGVGPLLVLLAVVAPFSARHGARVADEDVGRVARARAASGSQGPYLLLVTQEGCAYCQGLLADVLGDERVARALMRTRGLEEVAVGDPRVRDVDGVRTRAPTLIVLGPDGRERGRIPGYVRDPAAYATRLLTIVEGRAR